MTGKEPLLGTLKGEWLEEGGDAGNCARLHGWRDLQGAGVTPLSIMIERASSCEKVLTAQGRGRYFLRLALNQKLLATAIQQLARNPTLLEEVLFDVKETEVFIQEKTSSKVLFQYPYPEISCVGRRLDSNHLFAFCVGVSSGTPEHSTFDCLVFESNSERECEEIIKRIDVKTLTTD
ncbi:hypothetical protein UY3_19234 [Chelonia mydas]|uniref:RUN domain-containing protein n=1 Tax=Chelonia mydas TaxID=8469 RepID=M7B6B3_CHEMY|nr:hypothetical protein UY3_19234 [Chelonia mydas]